MRLDELEQLHAALPPLDTVVILENDPDPLARTWNDPAWRFYQRAVIEVPALLRVARAAKVKEQAERHWYAMRDVMSGDPVTIDWEAARDAGKRVVAATAELRAALAALEEQP